MTEYSLHTIDIVIIAVYFVMVIFLGIFYTDKNENAEDYFLAGRKMTWPFVGLSLFASQVSSTSLVGLSSTAYSTGISVYNYEWVAAIILAFFVIFILPLYLRSQVYTMPEYLERRYNGFSRTYFAILTLILNIVIDTAGSLYASSLVVQHIFPNIETWRIIVTLAFLAFLYTYIGGLSAVIITDAIQAVLLIIGSLLISYYAYMEAGGWANIKALVPEDKLMLIRPLDDPGVSWLGIILGVPILGFYFWCTNQFMVQRILGAKNVIHGRRGALFAGLLKLPLLFIMVLPGTAAIILHPELEKTPDSVFPTLMFDLLPVGILGLVLAGFTAALMSQIDSTLNSASTLVTIDFVQRKHPEYSSKKLMRIGRYVTLVFMVLAVFWAPFIENFGSLFKYLQKILAYTVPPVVVLFLFGSFWSRANPQGAIATIVMGLLLGPVLYIGIEKMGLVKLHFLLVAPIVFTFCAIAMVVVSLMTPAPSPEAVAQYLWTPETYKRESKELEGVAWYANYRFQALILVILSIVMLILFW